MPKCIDSWSRIGASSLPKSRAAPIRGPVLLEESADASKNVHLRHIFLTMGVWLGATHSRSGNCGNAVFVCRAIGQAPSTRVSIPWNNPNCHCCCRYPGTNYTCIKNIISLARVNCLHFCREIGGETGLVASTTIPLLDLTEFTTGSWQAGRSSEWRFSGAPKIRDNS